MPTLKFISEAVYIYFAARTPSIESITLLLNFSLVMEFLRNVFTNFIFGKLFSHEALVTGSRAATSEKFRGGGKVTFGNDYDVIDVQSTMMRLCCYEQHTNIGGGTFFIVGGHERLQGGWVGICSPG